MDVVVGHVAELRCFPVKSMGGLTADAAVFDDRAMRHDRLWAVRGAAGRLGSGKPGRRFQRMAALPSLTAYCPRPDVDEVVFRLPGGAEAGSADPDVEARLSQALGEPVTLHREGAEQHFDDSPVHLVTQREIAEVEAASGVAVHPLRLRANILVAPAGSASAAPDPAYVLPPEREWTGRRIAVGPQVVLEVIEPMQRCVMVNQATPDLPADNRVFKAVTAVNGMTLGLCLRVARPGVARVGDPVRVGA